MWKSKYCSKKTFKLSLLLPALPRFPIERGGTVPGAPSVIRLSPTADRYFDSASSIAFSRPFERRRFFEPLFVDLGVAAVFDRFLQAFVDLFEQFGVFLGDRDPVRFFGRDFFDDFDAAEFFRLLFGDRRVDDHRFDRPGLQRVVGVGAFRVGPEFRGFGFFLAEFEPGRALLGGDDFALEVGEAGDRAAFFDQDRLFGEVVGQREGDHLFAFFGDRRGRHHGFELALGDVAEDRFEGGVDEFRFTPDLFADRFHQFDVEAGVAALFPLLERGIGDVGADRQRFAAAARFFFAFGFFFGRAAAAVLGGSSLAVVSELELLPPPPHPATTTATSPTRSTAMKAASRVLLNKPASDQKIAGPARTYTRSRAGCVYPTVQTTSLHFLK